MSTNTITTTLMLSGMVLLVVLLGLVFLI